MSEPERIAEQLRRAFDGDSWSGPSLAQALAGITAAQAAAHPWAGVHSIGELVRHLTTWAATAARRIEERNRTVLVGEDWPPFPAIADEATWQQARQALREAHQHLLARTAALSATELDLLVEEGRNRPDDSGETIYVLLHGAVQHYLYHAGQIALLRKFV